MRTSFSLTIAVVLVAVLIFAWCDTAVASRTADAKALRLARRAGMPRRGRFVALDEDDDHHNETNSTHDDHDDDHHNETDHDDDHHNETDHDDDHHNETDHDDHDDDHDDHDDHDVHAGHNHAGHNHAGHDEHEDAHGADNLKIMSIIVLFFVSMIVGCGVIFLPGIITSCAGSMNSKRAEMFVSLASAFSAGVFLVVGVTHLLGEAALEMLGNYGQETDERYRPAYAVAIGGYLLMVLIQKGIIGETHSHGFVDEQNKDDKEESADGEEKELDKEPKTISVVVKSSEPAEYSSSPSFEDDTVKKDDATKDEAPAADAKEEPKKVTGATLAALMAVLLIHSFVEGVALGLQKNQAGALIVFIAVISHQWAEDFAVAVNTGRMGLSTGARVLFTTMLAAGCPLGIGIAWAVQSSLPKIATAYVLAVSCGTFIYIACTEVVPNEFPKTGGSFKHVFALILGVGLQYMVLVLAYDKEAHNH